MKFSWLKTMDMRVGTLIHWFQIKHNITKVNEYFVGMINSWIALPTKKKHEIKSPMNKNYFTVSDNLRTISGP